MIIKKFKDKNGKIHEIEVGFEYMLPANCIEIDQTEFDILVAPVPLTPAQQAIEHDRLVEYELGGDNIRILISVIKEIIMDGTIASKTPEEIIIQAKITRRNEL